MSDVRDQPENTTATAEISTETKYATASEDMAVGERGKIQKEQETFRVSVLKPSFPIV
ncbi:hypothetical protein EGR_03825 [Echinococcus granulosus]|uniref:Uncharacterized protein n=1 Tax=Echinococcus granulosus TaxID=6210 RepID=W6V527_ECHGR|nr:hypothetical protein EGR_03825 [Echinococcus granulosus]EUB61339.1 hypothetical protein EGR_03825 [Echinococcus granulosus]